jgi:hypothetical protein
MVTISVTSAFVCGNAMKVESLWSTLPSVFLSCIHRLSFLISVEKRPLERHGYRREVNVKIYLKEIE